MTDATNEREDRLARLAKKRARAAGPKLEGPARVTANVCNAADCLSLESDKVVEALVDDLEARDIHDVAVKKVGCLGLCAAGPLVHLPETNQMFENVTAENASELGQTLATAKPDGTKTELAPFYSRQVKIALENSGSVDPESIDDYIDNHHGYEGLRKAVTEMERSEVIEHVVKSGLRGRGGGGYPTGLKWRTVQKQLSTEPRVVICNADEGDPGAFMDRSVLESDPHRVLEGMAIAAYAIGATEGWIYCRAEYPLAVQRLKTAIRHAERKGMLGNNIADSPFDFKVDIRLGAGAFVCGEETALIASVQGGRGTPTPRPPYPAQSGLWGRPTLINNVETFASVAPIIRNGGDWYAGIGTETSKGTKVFALAGRVVNTGLIEVPMGISLREIIFDIGGGVIDGRPLKAVQTGGPSGGCIPAEFVEMGVDYESLSQMGSIMGSGGMIVMDDTSCMVDVAKFFMDFCREESCGKCVPCRVGTTQLHTILTKITEGEAVMTDLKQLEELSGMVKSTSLCGLGQTAPNPVFSTLKYFRHEYVAHIEERTCPAGVCPVASLEGAR